MFRAAHQLHRIALGSINNHPAIVSQLLSDDKMDASLKDCWNRTALKLAIDRGHAECVTILRQHGAPE